MKIKLSNTYDYWGLSESKNTAKKIQVLMFAGAILGILAPFGTTEKASLLPRLVYWMSLIVFAGLIAQPIERVTFPYFLKKGFHVFVAYVGFSAILSGPVFAIIILGEIAFYGAVSIQQASSFLLNFEYGIWGYLLLYGQVFFITLLINGLTGIIYGKPNDVNAVTTPTSSGKKFLARLPREIGTDLVCLSMEDHYVRTHTAQGDALIFMRLSDALLELEDYPGFQIHRSWWVAVRAITHVTKEKRRYTVHLNNGMTAPASQTYVKLLKENGFI
ncbi:MAG: LytTR family DNA-binding domain-containing protein [Kordiimonas sp.]